MRDLTLYGGYSRGFRSGGFNQTGVGAVAAGTGVVGVGDIYQAETADTYEVGAKSTLFHNLLTFNASGFTTISKNGYFFVFLAANSTQNLGNVPRTRLRGFELESALHPARGLELNASLGVTYSRIESFPDPTDIGHEAPFISRYTLNVGGQYETNLGDSDLKARVRLDYRRIGRTWFDVPNSTSRNPVDLVDPRVSLGRRPLDADRLCEQRLRQEIQRRIFARRLRLQGAPADLRTRRERQVLSGIKPHAGTAWRHRFRVIVVIVELH